MLQILELVRERFGVSVPQAPSPQGFTPRLPEEDSDEAPVDLPAMREPAGDSVNGLTIIISYRDAKGAASLRQVSCIRIETGQGKRYLRAFCHHRRAQRVFLMTRIEAVHDAETGEELAGGTDYFAPFADDRIGGPLPGAARRPWRRPDGTHIFVAMRRACRCRGE